jgi:hypothetical protein
VLLFLGTVFSVGTSFLLLCCGAVRRSSFFVRLGGGAALTAKRSYLPAGGNIFAQSIATLAYSLIGAETAAALGRETQQVSARGEFIIVRVKTWFPA